MMAKHDVTKTISRQQPFNLGQMRLVNRLGVTRCRQSPPRSAEVVLTLTDDVPDASRRSPKQCNWRAQAIRSTDRQCSIAVQRRADYLSTCGGRVSQCYRYDKWKENVTMTIMKYNHLVNLCGVCLKKNCEN